MATGTIDIIVGEQRRLIKQLSVLCTNLKKEPIIRRTKENIEKKARELFQTYEAIKTNHEDITQHQDESRMAAEYLISKEFEDVERIYTATIELARTMMNAPPEDQRLKTDFGGNQINTPTHGPSDDEAGQRLNTTQLRNKLQLLGSELIRLVRDADCNSTSGTYLKHSLKVIEECWTSLSETREKLLPFIGADDIIIKTYCEWINLYRDIVVEINEQQERVQEARMQQKESITIEHQDDVKLPQMNLPTFSGSFNNWIPFRDMFQQLVHNNKKLSNLTKLHYLKTSVTGEAAQLLQHLATSEQNYLTAWETLNNRYHNMRLLVSAHLRKVIGQSAISTESTSAIKKLLDITRENLQSLSNLGIDTSTWDPIILEILLPKLDSESQRQYEQSLPHPKELPTMEQFYDFLERRFQTLEIINQNKPKHKDIRVLQGQLYPGTSRPRIAHNYQAAIKTICRYCKRNHSITDCTNFKNIAPKHRVEFVSRAKLCPKCLKHFNHVECSSLEKCSSCQESHHYLLHQEGVSRSYHFGTTTGILLATAVIKTRDALGNETLLRALIDPGSQATLITSEAAQLLSLPRHHTFVEIFGISQKGATISRQKIIMEIMPRDHSSFKAKHEAWILPKLTGKLPESSFENNYFKTRNLMLADNNYNISASIDIILGADIYGYIIEEGLIKSNEEGLVAQKTKLGWIIFGTTKEPTSAPSKFSCLITNIDLDRQLRKFWEQEETLESETFPTEAEKQCENLFTTTTTRNDNGGFIVYLPFKNNSPQLGLSRPQALARYLHLERKFKKDPILKGKYQQFLDTYLKLGHMRKIDPNNKDTDGYYMPHHAVIKRQGSESQLRVVFDASMKTTSGRSLNDCMLTTPALQNNLFAILLRWRTYQYVFTSDIEKMYRQIKIGYEHQKFQRILWRNTIDEPIEEYELTTVTYGTAAAPFLAIRVLFELAKLYEHQYPQAANTIIKESYVDDILTGKHSLAEAKKHQLELITVLQNGGFTLKKWASNNKELLQSIPSEDRLIGNLEFPTDETSELKMLGVLWNPRLDLFTYNVNTALDRPITKRTIVSEAAKLFDPMGWISPVTIHAKILIQELWKLGFNWDDPLPPPIGNRWKKWQQELKYIENFEIPRWFKTSNIDQKVILHGFSDASEGAYSAVVYMKVIDGENRQTTISLVASKTKVASLTPKRTIPQLELCGALLLAKLLHQVQQILKLSKVEIYTWTDSSIVLAWLKEHPSKWKTFIANRVSNIQTLFPDNQWHYISTKDNPADCASRGIYPSKLVHFKLWWEGPQWLKTSNTISTVIEPVDESKLERKRIFAGTSTGFIKAPDLIEKFSSLLKLQRVIAYCCRFAHNTRKERKSRQAGFLTGKELQGALNRIIYYVQRKEFNNEVTTLEQHKPLNRKNRLLPLNPFLDNENILRVGGRLQNAALPYQQRFPAILPSSGHLTSLIIESAHRTVLHGNVSQTMAYIRRRFWILHGSNSIRKILHLCVKCHRYKTDCVKQIMGNLPAARVTPARPFKHCGVDYAGPIQIRTTKGRGYKSYKGYISLFICLSTKAIHLEAVSDLTSDAFVAAFRRFSARRGIPSDMYSDCGTNFIGAQRQLDAAFAHALKSVSLHAAEIVANEGTNWHFIPPSAPHFGGLWEAGVKSMKYHLKRVIGDSTLTFEELTTILCQIEACLNSRPLCPISNHTDEIDYLTPGHFLIGEACLTPPEANLRDSKVTAPERWKILQKMTQQFWEIWSTEYLSRLQQRPKWLSKERDLKVGQLVILKEPNIPPARWLMGKVIETHCGNDGHVRVVTIKCKGNTILKRPITKISPLPSEDSFTPDIDSSVPKPVTFNSIKPQASQESHTSGIPSSDRKRKATSSHTKSKNKNTVGPENLPEVPSRKWRPNLRISSKATEKAKELADNLKNKRPCKSRNTVRIRPCLGATALMYSTLILSLFSICSSTIHEKVDIKPISAQTGIYFENIGNLNRLATHWKMIVHFNLDNYWEEINYVNHYMERMNRICQHEESATSINWCEVVIHQLGQRLNKINNMNMLLQHNNHQAQRVRRGVGDTIGNILGDMFGILNQRDAEVYQREIERSKMNEDYIMNLISNQTSIIDATLNVFKHNINITSTNFAKLDDRLTKLEQDTKFLLDDSIIVHHAQSVLILATQTMLLMNEIEDSQTNMLDVLSHTHLGLVHPLILTPSQLANELTKIMKNLPSSMEIPGLDKSNLLHIYKMITIKSWVSNSTIILYAQLPITYRENFQIFHLVSVATGINNYQLCIEPSTKYLMVNSDRERYSPISDDELRSFLRISTDRYIGAISPIYNLLANVSSCEINMLRRKSDPHSSCKFKKLNQTSSWVQLKVSNKWIYSLNQETTFDLICDQSISAIQLNGSGIITLQDYCILKGANFALSALNSQINASNIWLSFIPQLNITEPAPHQLPIHNETTNHISVLETIGEDLNTIERNIKFQKSQETLPNGINSHDIHHYTISYVLLALILIFIIWYSNCRQSSGPRNMSTAV